MQKIKFLILLGILIYSTQGMAQQPAIDKGMEWLKITQNTTGSWGDEEMIAPAVIDTAAVLDAFYYLNETGLSYSKGIEWLGTQNVFSCSLLSRKIKTLAESGRDTSSLVDFLLNYRRDDDAFGGYGIENLNTTLALFALKSANYTNTTVISNALSYLLANQNTDSGFGVAGGLSLADESAKQSNVYITSLALLILTQYRKDFYLEESLTKAGNWLISQQKPDGSFGTLWETGLAYSALMKVGSEKWGAGSKTACLEHILANQKANDSNGSVICG